MLLKIYQKLSITEKKHTNIALGLCLAGIIGFIAQMIYFRIKFQGLDDWLAILTFWITFIMPGYLANAMMVIVGGGKPLDGEKFAKDGRRLFGPGKSLRGFWLGPLLGAIIALGIHGILFWQWNNIVQAVDGFIANPNVNYYMYLNQREPLLQNLALFILGDSDYSNPFHAFLKLVPRVFLCAYGAAVGDLFGSWAKRRRNLKRGEPFWGVDQVDFLVGCLLFAGWFVFLPITFISGQVLLMLIIITPTITILANNISFFMGRKTVPW